MKKDKICSRMKYMGVVTKKWADSQDIPWPSIRRTVKQFFGDRAINIPGKEYRLAA